MTSSVRGLAAAIAANTRFVVSGRLNTIKATGVVSRNGVVNAAAYRGAVRPGRRS
jgi:hypothetical protein